MKPQLSTKQISMMKSQISPKLIQNLLPDPPDNMVGYDVEMYSARWYAIWLKHPDYDYKQGVRSIYAFVNQKGQVYAPLHVKPSNKFVCELVDLFKQNPYTTIETKPNPLLKYL